MSVRSGSSRTRVLGIAVAVAAIAVASAALMLRSRRGADPTEPLARKPSAEAASPIVEPRADPVEARASADALHGDEPRVVAAEPVVAAPPGSLAGSVSFADGSVPPPILLRLVRYEDDASRANDPGDEHAASTACVHEIHAPTDADGRFEAAGLCPGRYRAEAVLPQTMYANGLFEVPARDARYVLQGYLLIARALDPSRAPVRGVHVAVEYQQDPDAHRPEPSVASWSRVTDAEGCFWLPIPEPGDVRLRVLGLGPDGATDVVSLRLTPGIVRKDIWLPILPGRASLRVRLTACADGAAPVRDYCLALEEIGSKSATLRLCSETADADVFRSIPPGRYRATPIARNFGKAPAWYREFPGPGWDLVLEDGREALLAQCVELGGRVQILVRADPARATTEAVEVELLDDGGEPVRKLTFRDPQPSGGLRLALELPAGVERLADTLLDPGERTLRIRAAGRADRIVSVKVVAGEATRLVVDLASAQ